MSKETPIFDHRDEMLFMLFAHVEYCPDCFTDALCPIAKEIATGIESEQPCLN